MVSLADLYMFELVMQDRADDYTTFAHAFVLGVGPEGAIVWQGGGEEDGDPYGLSEWINDGNARVLDWQQAGRFVDNFEKLVAYKVSPTQSSV